MTDENSHRNIRDALLEQTSGLSIPISGFDSRNRKGCLRKSWDPDPFLQPIPVYSSEAVFQWFPRAADWESSERRKHVSLDTALTDRRSARCPSSSLLSSRVRVFHAGHHSWMELTSYPGWAGDCSRDGTVVQAGKSRANPLQRRVCYFLARNKADATCIQKLPTRLKGIAAEEVAVAFQYFRFALRRRALPKTLSQPVGFPVLGTWIPRLR